MAAEEEGGTASAAGSGKKRRPGGPFSGGIGASHAIVLGLVVAYRMMSVTSANTTGHGVDAHNGEEDEHHGYKARISITSI